MKKWLGSRWPYRSGGIIAAGFLLLEGWNAHSGGVVHWWSVVPTIALLLICTFELLRVRKPDA
jgi:hypothetical protein